MLIDMLNNKLSIDNNRSTRRQMTENKKCKVKSGAGLEAGSDIVDLGGFLKIRRLLDKETI